MKIQKQGYIISASLPDSDMKHREFQADYYTARTIANDFRKAVCKDVYMKDVYTIEREEDDINEHEL